MEHLVSANRFKQMKWVYYKLAVPLPKCTTNVQDVMNRYR